MWSCLWKYRYLCKMNKNRCCYLSALSDSGPMSLPAHLPNSYLPKEPPPRATESLASINLPLRGPLANPSGSPHIGNMMHPPMPPSCIMEELQRAFASKNRQERWVLRLTHTSVCISFLPQTYWDYENQTCLLFQSDVKANAVIDERLPLQDTSIGWLKWALLTNSWQINYLWCPN